MNDRLMQNLIGDGITESSYILNKVVQMMPPNGGKITLPPGDYFLQRPLQINRNNVTIEGAGRETTRLIVGSEEQIGIAIGHECDQVSRITVKNLTVNSFQAPTKGAAIQAVRAYDVRITDCIVANMAIGVEFKDVYFGRLTDTEIIDPMPGGGVGVLVHGDGIHNDQYLTRVFVQCRTHAAPCAAGFRIANTQAAWINACGAFGCATGLHLLATGGRTLEHVFLSENAMDSCKGPGFLVEAGESAVVRRLRSSGDWSCSNDGCGWTIAESGGRILALDIAGCRLYNNHGSGIWIGGGDGITIDGSSISGNGRDGVSSGIDVANTRGLLAIRNNIIGPYAGFDDTQAHAINGLDKAPRLFVSGNVFEATTHEPIVVPTTDAILKGNLYPSPNP